MLLRIVYVHSQSSSLDPTMCRMDCSFTTLVYRCGYPSRCPCKWLLRCPGIATKSKQLQISRTRISILQCLLFFMWNFLEDFGLWQSCWGRREIVRLDMLWTNSLMSQTCMWTEGIFSLCGCPSEAWVIGWSSEKHEHCHLQPFPERRCLRHVAYDFTPLCCGALQLLDH